MKYLRNAYTQMPNDFDPVDRAAWAKTWNWSKPATEDLTLFPPLLLTGPQTWDETIAF